MKSDVWNQEPTKQGMMVAEIRKVTGGVHSLGFVPSASFTW